MNQTQTGAHVTPETGDWMAAQTVRQARGLTAFLPAAAATFLLLLAAGCRSTPPPAPDPASLRWVIHTSESAGYSVELPDVYKPQEAHDGKDTLVRYQGFALLVINFVDADEGRHRGLWFGHEAAGDIELGGRPGWRYVYNHFDGPVFTRVVSYVVEHRGKYLGVEFRTDLEEPDAIQQHILDSFRFH